MTDDRMTDDRRPPSEDRRRSSVTHPSIGVRFMVRRSMTCVVLLLSLLVVRSVFLEGSAGANSWHSAADNETPAKRDQRMKWWRQARCGMFIHWGLYAVP